MARAIKGQGRFAGMAALAALLGGCGGGTVTQPVAAGCAPVDEAMVAGLFDQWNTALVAHDLDAITALYADDAILLPTLSNQVRRTPAERRDYFAHFVERGPVGTIDERDIRLGCDSAIDAGLYTFTFAADGGVARARYSYSYELGEDGIWRIGSHHSSLLPEPVE